MNRRSCLIFLLVNIALQGLGQVNLGEDLISDSLRTGSNAVVRYHYTTYDRESLEDYSVQVHYAVTILNARGKHVARLSVPYDQNSEVTSIVGTVYNSEGKELANFKKKDIKDYASNASFTLFSDHRVKTISPAITTFPFTVAYDYKVKYKGIVGLGTWLPLRWFNVSTEKAQLIINSPAHLAVRYKALNHDFDFTRDNTDKVDTYKWTTRNLKAIKSEPNLPHYLDYMPVVLLSPEDIAYEGSQGSFRSWSTYGKWVYGLIKDRGQLPDETVNRIKRLTDTIPDTIGKVKAIYEYMQNRTRYVNVALGIGGFQPLHAYEVDEKGYGDCKALSNYTKALLNCVGINSYYAEIGNGRSKELKFPDFASANQTNHVILCIPMYHDTTWLECTSQTLPFGYIGTSNSDRYALLVTEQGGMLTRTPVYEALENVRNSKSDISIEDNGNALYNITTDFVNAEFEDVSGLLQISRKEQREALLKYVSLEGLSLEDFSLVETTSNKPGAQISMKGKVSRLASKSGTRLFFQPEYPFSQTGFNSISKSRENNLYMPIGYCHVDTLIVSPPKEYILENIPQDMFLESVYGRFMLNFNVLDDKIYIYRSIEIFAGEHDCSVFEEINEFLNAIRKSDEKKVVLKKGEV